MRVLFQRVTFVSLLAIFFSLTSLSWGAPPPISFDTKFTHLLDKTKKVPITGPGNFDIYQFSGTPNFTDVAVPTHNDLGTLLGLENLNNWPSTTVDTYYNNHSFTNADKINFPHQVIAGNFDGNTTKDLVIINYDSFVVCYDYTGDACSGGYSNLYQESWGPVEFKSHLLPWAGVVADFDGDGKDDLAVIGYSTDNGTYGELFVYKGNGTGGATPLTGTYNAPTNLNPNTTGIPLSIAVADFDGDNKLDIVTAQYPLQSACDTTTGAYLLGFSNAGGVSFTPTAIPSVDFKQADCYYPTGLLAYDLDNNGQKDLVLTCYEVVTKTEKITPPATQDGGFLPSSTCNVTYGSGPVAMLKKTGNFAFAKQPPLQDLNLPYTTAAGDYNKDGFTDLAVASNGGSNVITFAGTGAFTVQTPGSKISTWPYPPKYIQTSERNDVTALDNRPDLTLTATRTCLLPGASGCQPPKDDVTNIKNYWVDVYLDKPFDSVNLFQGSFAQIAPLVAADVPSYRSFRAPTPSQFVYEKNLAPSVGAQGRFLITSRSLASQESLAVSVDQIIGKVNVISQDGVVDLVNFSPNISIEEPDCTTKVVKVHSTVTSPHKIATLTLTTTDSPDWTGTANFQVTPALPTQSPDATFNLPEGQQVYTFTITAKDDAGTPNEYKLSAKIDRTGCVPPPTVTPQCPAAGTKDAVVWVNDPWTVSVADSLTSQAVGKTVSWTGPAELFGLGSQSVEKTVTTSGPSLSGALPFYTGGVDRVFNFSYSIQDGPQNCPVRLVQKSAIAEGHGGVKCSLSPLGADSGNAPIEWIALFGFSGAPLLFARLKSRRK